MGVPLWYVVTPQVRQFDAGIPGGWGGDSLAHALAHLPTSVQNQLSEHPDWFEL